jgi:hypothetical protein
MRISRHAKNRMRLHALSRDEVLGIVSTTNRNGEDPDGNPLYVKEIRGTRFRAVLALDDMSTIITVYDLEA